MTSSHSTSSCNKEVTVYGRYSHNLLSGARNSVLDWMLWAQPRYNTQESEEGQDVGTVIFLAFGSFIINNITPLIVCPSRGGTVGSTEYDHSLPSLLTPGGPPKGGDTITPSMTTVF